MRTLRYFMLTASVLCGINSHAYAEGSYNETYNVMGCKSYLVSKEQTRGWLMGYLTAMENSRGGNALQGRNPQQIYNLFDSYCRANPLYTMDDAANFVFMKLQRR